MDQQSYSHDLMRNMRTFNECFGNSVIFQGCKREQGQYRTIGRDDLNQASWSWDIWFHYHKPLPGHRLHPDFPWLITGVYAKLPHGFYIPTPVGDYNPDWAIALRDGAVKHVYFVTETKGSMSTLDLRQIELTKIECVRKFILDINKKIAPKKRDL